MVTDHITTIHFMVIVYIMGAKKSRKIYKKNSLEKIQAKLYYSNSANKRGISKHIIKIKCPVTPSIKISGKMDSPSDAQARLLYRFFILKTPFT